MLKNSNFQLNNKKNWPIMHVHCAISMEIIINGAVHMCDRPVSINKQNGVNKFAIRDLKHYF